MIQVKLRTFANDGSITAEGNFSLAVTEFELCQALANCGVPAFNGLNGGESYYMIDGGTVMVRLIGVSFPEILILALTK